ncbi:MAG: DUF5681 domain-containing protein [Candidatus Acidiferrales bacterium]
MPEDSASAEFEIGFGRPPKRSRFQKGVSGNPKGRPKGRRNLATVLAKTLHEKVVVNENGVRRKVTKLEAAVKQLVNKAANGDLGALRHLTALVEAAERQAPGASRTELTDSDLKVMQNVLQRAENCSRGEENES